MLNLIAKDFKLIFSNKGSKTSRLLSILLTLVVCGIFIYFETAAATIILKRIKIYNNAAQSLFIIFLFVLAILLSIFCLFTANKIFFNEEDNIQLSHLPVSNIKKVISKMVFLFLFMYFFNLIFTLPIFISYGIIFDKILFYFYASIYYPALIFLFEAGIALIFLIPFKTLMDFLKKHTFIQLIFVIVLGLFLSIIYGVLLKGFIEVMNSNKVDLFFTKESLDTLKATAKYLFPVNLIAEAFISNSVSNVFSFFAISSGIFILGATIVTYFYSRFSYIGSYNNVHNKKTYNKIRVTSPRIALIKKELIILFRDSNFIISFTGLLFVEPLLLFFIVRGVNTIFSSGSLIYYALLVPDLVKSMDLFIFLLIVAIIAQGGTNYLSNENKSMRIIKTIPVKETTQLAIKILIPLVSVVFFSFLSIFVLNIAGLLSFIDAFFFFIISSLFVCVLSLISMYEELKIKRNSERTTIFSNIYIYIVPLLIFFVMLFFSYFKIKIIYSYLISLAFIVLCGSPIFLNMNHKIKKWFIEMEVIN